MAAQGALPLRPEESAKQPIPSGLRWEERGLICGSRTLCGHEKVNSSSTASTWEDIDMDTILEEAEGGASCSSRAAVSAARSAHRPGRCLGEVARLPEHLWLCVAQYQGAADSCAAMRCSRWLCCALQVQPVWRFHATGSARCARPVRRRDSCWRAPAGAAPAWAGGAPGPLLLDRRVDWRRLVQANYCGAPRSASAHIWVRVRPDMEIRLPLLKGAPGGSGALKALVRQVLLSSRAAAPQGGHEWGPWHLRLRVLQWDGRPGALADEGRLMAGGRYFLERAVRGAGGQWEWELPPASPAPSDLSGGSRWVLGCSTRGPCSWSLGGLPAALWPRAALQAPLEARGERLVLVRVVSRLLPQERWLSANLDAPLANLYQDLADALCAPGAALASAAEPPRFQLMDSAASASGTGADASQHLRAFYWTQSETICVEPEGARLFSAEGAGPARLLVWRERAFEAHRARAAQRPAPAEELDELPAQEPFARHATEPAARGGRWDGGSGGAAWRRSVSSSPVVTRSAASAAPRPRAPAAPPARAAPAEASRGPVPAVAGDCPAVDMEVEEEEEDSVLCAQSSDGWEANAPSRPASAAPAGGPAERERGLEVAGVAGLPSAAGALASEGAEGAPPEQPARGGEAAPSAGQRPRLPPQPPPHGHGAARSGSGAFERQVRHSEPRLLPGTLRTRQFEFHPSLDVLLTGDRMGRVNVLCPSEAEATPRQPLHAGPTPVLALVWLRRHPESAICGTARSGRISFLRYDPEAAPGEQAVHLVSHTEEFPQLSSLSANCTDDFLLASGISPDVAVYDVQTGRVLQHAAGVHEHLINISRFCHTSPHIFATASFDHTCRVWDLRQPLRRDHPVKTLHTGGCNVMCNFSPDDAHLLCSGVDTRVSQFEVPSWNQVPERFPLREPSHQDRYRRSIYLESGKHFVTAATEEAHLHVMSIAGQNLGVVDFHSCGQYWNDGVLQVESIKQSALGATLPPLGREDGHSDLMFCEGWPTEWALDGQGSAPPPAPHARAAVQEWPSADAGVGQTPPGCAFIQSVRAHPTLQSRLGVLLCPAQGDQSCVAMVDLDTRCLSGHGAC